MKKRLLFLLLATGGTALVTAQTTISNTDGTYSLFYYSPYGSTIIYPDGSHALMVDHDSTASTIIYSDFSYSRIFYNGSATTVVHSDFSYTVFYNEYATPAAPLPHPDDPLFSAGVSDTIKNAADTGYFLLSDDATVKPDPEEARYILLNDLVDTATMRSRPAPAQQPSSGAAAPANAGNRPILRSKGQQPELKTEHNDL